MPKTEHRLGLILELRTQFFNQRLLTLGGHGHPGCGFVTVAEIFYEKFLDGDPFFKFSMKRLVGAAKTSATDEAGYPVCASFQESADR